MNGGIEWFGGKVCMDRDLLRDDGGIDLVW